MVPHRYVIEVLSKETLNRIGFMEVKLKDHYHLRHKFDTYPAFYQRIERKRAYTFPYNSACLGYYATYPMFVEFILDEIQFSYDEDHRFWEMLKPLKQDDILLLVWL